jgi:hypothetical protein
MLFFSFFTLLILILQLKKFRDQQQQQNGNDHMTFISETNGTSIHSINGVRFLSKHMY